MRTIILSVLALVGSPMAARAQGQRAGETLVTRVTNAYPAFSPDGRIYVVNADGTGLRRITSDPADERQPCWSPDGSSIVFSRYVWFPEEPFFEASEIYLLQMRAPDGD